MTGFPQETGGYFDSARCASYRLTWDFADDFAVWIFGHIVIDKGAGIYASATYIIDETLILNTRSMMMVNL